MAVVVCSIGPAVPAVHASTAEPAQHARARLVSEQSGVTPGGVLTVGVHFEIDPQWHIYWPGQNDSGAPTTLAWKLPPGWTVDEPQWPAPFRHIDDGDLLDHVYEAKVTILATLHAPADAKPGDALVITCECEWLVCKSTCLPGAATVSTTIKVIPAGDKPTPTADAPLFAAARKRIPRSAEGVAISWQGSTVTLSVPGARQLMFFPLAASAQVPGLATTGVSKTPTLTMRTEKAGPDKPLRGVLEVHPAAGPTQWFRIESAPTTAPPPK